MKTDGRLASEWNPPHRDCIFWGKFVHEGPRCLPLVTHSLDVALVFRRLCTLNAVRRSLEHTTASELTDQVLDRLAVMAMFHDVGKANLGFQFKVFDKSTKQAGHIRELAPILDQAVYDEELRYAFIQALPPELPSWFCDGEAATSYLMAIFSHHGKPLQFRGETTGSYGHAKGWWQPRDGWEPMSAIREIAESARTVFPAAFAPGGPPLPPEPRFHHRFAGLVIAADWLGSHGYWFPVDRVGFTERLQHDRRVIPKLLQAVGLDVMPLRELLQMRTGEGWDCFERRFDLSPRPLQQAIDTLDPDDSRARLVIAESETGSGKTEAALNWFIKLFVAGKVDGLYFALPTRVAARELYTRIDCTINDWFPDSDNRPVTLLAVPGYAQVNGIAPERILPDSEAANRWQDDNVTRLRERQWAAERPKRFLAATVAVGTIDQALLSIVQTSHAHLRSVFLDRSLLVVDEVHASDTYASQLLQSLLEHHLGVGGYAMLLSATLGSQARNTYVSVSGGRRSLAT
ncbi:MAG: CRISPR-associated endonuclease Cas3'', partial [Firmicutes bacterium]|nr:CRISPR-associated endonuclease Cas3'' [Bacillota bacterium]